MKDKIRHIIAGMLIAGFIGLPCYLNSCDLFAGLWGCLAGVVAAAVKEWCDNNTDGNKWDWKDFGFTCLGAVIVALFIVGLHFGKG